MSLEGRKFYSISELARETGIPQKSLNVLLEHHGAEIPFVMDGERRRFTPEAVSITQRFWRAFKAGISQERTSSDGWYSEILQRIGASAERLAEAAKSLKELRADLEKNSPHRIFYINAFPGQTFQPAMPIAVHVVRQASKSRAFLPDANLEAYGADDRAAVLNLREVILRTFLRLEEKTFSEEEEEELSVLAVLISRRAAEDPLSAGKRSLGAGRSAPKRVPGSSG